MEESKNPRKIFTDCDEAYILREIKKDPHLSAPKLTQIVNNHLGIDANPETVRRVLRKHGFNGRIARKKPFISLKNRKKRLAFAREYFAKDMSFWQRVTKVI